MQVSNISKDIRYLYKNPNRNKTSNGWEKKGRNWPHNLLYLVASIWYRDHPKNFLSHVTSVFSTFYYFK